MNASYQYAVERAFQHTLNLIGLLEGLAARLDSLQTSGAEVSEKEIIQLSHTFSCAATVAESVACDLSEAAS